MLDLASGASIMDSYLHYDKLMQEKTIVPGSFRWFTEDSSSIQLNEKPLSGATTTRIRFGPCQMCTHPSLNVIDWAIEIDAMQWAVQIGIVDAATNIFSTANHTHAELSAAEGAAGTYRDDQVIEFWVGFPHAAAMFNQRILLPASSGASKSTLDYAAQEALISMLSIPKQTLSGNEGFMGLEDLMMGSNPGPGKIIRIPMSELKRASDVAGVNLYPNAGNAKSLRWIPNNPNNLPLVDINGNNATLTINGIIDLNLIDPLYGSFPIMTPQWVNTYLQLNMDNPLRNLQVIQLNVYDGERYLPICGGLPPEKPQPFFIQRVSYVAAAGPPRQGVAYEYSKRFIRFINITDMSMVGASSYNRPCYAINGKWKYLRTRQCIFQLEGQEQIMAQLTKQGALITPVKHFTTYNFNGVGWNNQMVSTGISTENIDKVYIQMPYTLEYPLFLPNPLLRNINPVFKNVLFNVSDSYLDAHARQKIYDCFVDTDKVSPSRNLIDSVHFHNLDQASDVRPYGINRLWNEVATSQSLSTTGSRTPIYYPNQFVLAFDLGGGNEFRGANSKMPGAMSTYSPAETFRLISEDSQETTLITTNATADELNTMGGNSGWCSKASWGRVANAKGTSIITCLSFGRMITRFNQGTGTVEAIMVE